jgi:hypothetical protein
MTFKCHELTGGSFGHEPQNRTGIWVNRTQLAKDRQYAENTLYPRPCDWWKCNTTVDADGGRAKDGFVLVIYTLVVTKPAVTSMVVG